MKTRTRYAAAAFIGLLISMPAMAGPVSWKAGIEDVTMGGEHADAFKFFSGGNTHAGTFDLNTLPGASATTPWLVLGKSGEDGMSFVRENLSVSFLSDKGEWTITNTSARDVSLDLILSLKAGNASGAFFFDKRSILAGQTLSGKWGIEWLQKEGNKHSPGFSNFAFFQREMNFVDVVEERAGAQVPEPASMALLGLGMLGMGALRKRRAG